MEYFSLRGETRMPTVIDLFSGAGGLSLGASRAGFTVGAAVEIDEHAMKTHRCNFPYTVHIQKDITTLTGADILNQANINHDDFLGIIGGPPCQGFSSIGHGDINDPRNQLFIKFFDIVSELQPVFFVAENVPGIMKDKYNPIKEDAFNRIPNYVILPPLSINASEYGAPTTRTRVFFIGFRECDLIHPFSITDIEAQKVEVSKKTTVRQALEGLQEDIRYTSTFKSSKALSRSYYSSNNHLQSDFFYERVTSRIPATVGNKEYIREYKTHHFVDGCIPTNHSKAVKKRYSKLKYNEQDKVSKSKRLDPDGYCPTLRAGTGPEKGSYQAVRPIHYKYNRVITPREAARLQGFPDWFKLPETIWHSFRQIGNSVSPIVAEQVLSAIYQKLTL